MIRANRRRVLGRRRGISMIEMMVMMTAVAVLLGMTVIVLRLLMKLDADGRGRLERAEAIGRLSRRFRSDVHASSRVEIVADDPKRLAGLRISPEPNHIIEYQPLDDGELARVETVGGELARRETFILPQTGPARLSVRDLDGRKFAVVGLDTVARKNRIDPVRTLEILAAVGLEGGRP